MGDVKIGRDEFNWEIWEGKELINHRAKELVSINIEPVDLNTEITNEELRSLFGEEATFDPKQWIITASHLEKNIYIPGRLLQVFLLLHKGVCWLTFHSHITFSLFLQVLKTHDNQDFEWIWESVNFGLFRDIGVLSDLYGLIEKELRSVELETIVRKYSTMDLKYLLQNIKKKIKKIDQNSEENPENMKENKKIIKKLKIEYSMIKSIAMRFTYVLLTEKAKLIVNTFKSHMYPDSIKKYGLLTEFIQVKAKVSLFYLHLSGINIDQIKWEELLEELRLKAIQCVEEIVNIMPYSRGIVQVDVNGELEIENAAEFPIPKLNKTRLFEILKLIVSELKQEYPELELPFNMKAQKILIQEDRMNVSFWKPYRKYHLFLEKWVEYETQCNLYRSARNYKEYIPKAYPEWFYLQKNGRVSCINPCIQTVPANPRFREIFIPREGHKFIIVDYCYIELCTFACIAEFTMSYSMLAKVIRDDIDPHCYTASIFTNLPLHEFNQLKCSDPVKYKTFRDLAKFFNFSIIAGIGKESLQQKIQATSDTLISLEDVQLFKKKLISKVYPEIQVFLHKNLTEIWIENLGCTKYEYYQACTFPKGSKYNKKHEHQIKRILKGTTKGNIKWEKPLWKAFINLNRNRTLVEPLLTAATKCKGGMRIYNLLSAMSICTLTGRIRRNVKLPVFNNTAYSGLAADGAKLALWNLTYVGFKVVAFIHDEFIIEVPEKENTEETITLIEQVIKESMQEVVRKVPVSCKINVADCWKM